MMAAAVEGGGGGQQWQRRTTIAAGDNSIQDQVVDYNGEGQERVAREGNDSIMALMAAAAEDSGSG
jgi:hypothetical protein